MKMMIKVRRLVAALMSGTMTTRMETGTEIEKMMEIKTMMEIKKAKGETITKPKAESNSDS